MTQTETAIMQKVQAVNELLLSQEPENISVDTYGGYSGYKPQYIIDALNSVFGVGSWGFEEISSEIVSVQTKEGTSTLAIAQVRVMIADVPFQPTGWGQARVTKGDLGDARKGAQTDAIKKCLSYFSIGNRAYQGLLPMDKSNNNKGTKATNGNTQRPTSQQPTKPATSTPPVQPTQRPTPAHTQETVQPAQSKKAAPVFTKLEDVPNIPQLKAQAEGLKMIWDAVLKTSCGKRYEAVVQSGDDATPEDCAIIAAFLNKVAQARAKQNGGDKLLKAS